MSLLSTFDQLIVKAVFETSIDQLAIMAGTLPVQSSSGSLTGTGTTSAGITGQGDQMALEHPNTTDKGLDEILPRELKIIQVDVTNDKVYFSAFVAILFSPIRKRSTRLKAAATWP